MSMTILGKAFRVKIHEKIKNWQAKFYTISMFLCCTFFLITCYVFLCFDVDSLASSSPRLFLLMLQPFSAQNHQKKIKISAFQFVSL